MSHAVIGVFHVRLSTTRIEPYKLVKQLVFTVSNLHSVQSPMALYGKYGIGIVNSDHYVPSTMYNASEDILIGPNFNSLSKHISKILGGFCSMNYSV